MLWTPKSQKTHWIAFLKSVLNSSPLKSQFSCYLNIRIPEILYIFLYYLLLLVCEKQKSIACLVGFFGFVLFAGVCLVVVCFCWGCLLFIFFRVLEFCIINTWMFKLAVVTWWQFTGILLICSFHLLFHVHCSW